MNVPGTLLSALQVSLLNLWHSCPYCYSWEAYNDKENLFNITQLENS